MTWPNAPVEHKWSMHRPCKVTLQRPTRCRFCDPSAKMKKGEEAVEIVVNGGPTGLFFLCVDHVQQFADLLIEAKLETPVR